MLKFLVGSHNYNLNTEESDKDWKVFLYPSFDNLYNNTYNTRPTTITENEDVETKDIRQMMDLFEKCNPAYFELLYSKESDHSDNMSESKFLNYILKNRDAIIFHNLPKFFSACMGTYDQKIKSLLKGTSGTQHLMEKFGYDTKAGVHAYRNLDIIERLYVIIECVVRYRQANWVHIVQNPKEHRDIIIREILSGYSSKIFTTIGELKELRSIYEILLRYDNVENKFNSDIFTGDYLPEPYKSQYKDLSSFLSRSFLTIWCIKDGRYTYNRLMGLLRQKESRVNELKNSEIFSKKYINFNVINQAKDILKEEVHEKLIKYSIRVENKYTEDMEENEKYILKLDYTEVEEVPNDDWDGNYDPLYENHGACFLVKLREPVKNDLYLSILPDKQEKE